MWQYNNKSDLDNELCHYGVLGMKWGRRRAQKKYDKNVKKNWHKAYNKASQYTNEQLIPALNKKYQKYDFSKLDTTDMSNPKGNPKLVKAHRAYIKEYEAKFDELMQQSYKDMFGDRPE